MIERNWPGAVFCLSLVLAFWQGSSCHSTHTSPSSNSSRSSANVNNAQVNNNGKTMQAPADLTGTWGGDHISMEVTAGGASIEYDCAHGAISEKIVPRPDGRFEVHGSHAPERGGPSRIGEDSGQAATYRGSIDGDTMKLTVILSKSNDTVGQFVLTHGKNGRLRKCL